MIRIAPVWGDAVLRASKMKKNLCIILLICVFFILLPFLLRGILFLAMIHTDRWDCNIDYQQHAEELRIVQEYISGLHPGEAEYYLSVCKVDGVVCLYDSLTGEYLTPQDSVTDSLVAVDKAIESSSEHTIRVNGSQITFTCCGAYALVYSPDHKPTDIPLRDCDRVALRRAGDGWYHAAATDNLSLGDFWSYLFEF